MSGTWQKNTLSGCPKILDHYNPNHPEHLAMREWCGEDFEPGRFDLSGVNERLEKLRV